MWSWPSVAELPETEAQQVERKARFDRHRQYVEPLKAERECAKQRQNEKSARPSMARARESIPPSVRPWKKNRGS